MFKHCGKREIAADPGAKGLPVAKLITEVDRWNSTYEMLQRFYEQRYAVAAALTTLPTDLHPLTANDIERASQCIKMLSPFHIELSHEKCVRIKNNIYDQSMI